MTDYALAKIGDRYFVKGLRDEDAPDTMLLVLYPEGDCDTVSEPGSKQMHRALYDLFQVSDTLKDGDCFTLDGCPVYRCDGVHVLPIREDA